MYQVLYIYSLSARSHCSSCITLREWIKLLLLHDSLLSHREVFSATAKLDVSTQQNHAQNGPHSLFRTLHFTGSAECAVHQYSSAFAAGCTRAAFLSCCSYQYPVSHQCDQQECVRSNLRSVNKMISYIPPVLLRGCFRAESQRGCFPVQ